MEKLTLSGLGIAAAGVIGTKYFDQQARKTSGQDQMNKYKISQYSSAAIPLGLGIAAYSGLLRGHPVATAVTAIPFGLGVVFATNFSLGGTPPYSKQGAALGYATSIGGVTYLLTKNTKTSLMVAGVSAALLYLQSMSKTSPTLEEPIRGGAVPVDPNIQIVPNTIK
jgi:hypothetical protein